VQHGVERLLRAEDATADLHGIFGPDLRGEILDDAAIQADATGFDDLLDAAAGAEAGGGEETIEAHGFYISEICDLKSEIAATCIWHPIGYLSRRLALFHKMSKLVIPRKTVYRLSLYYRALQRLRQNHIDTVSSAALSSAAGVKPTQLRKDLAYFGQFGTRGLGYNVAALSAQLTDVLGTTRLQPVILVGAGNLGSGIRGLPRRASRSWRRSTWSRAGSVRAISG
jgi:Putative DNA-binding protein N-terminus